MLERSFRENYKTTYYIKPSYGKYTVFKREYIGNEWHVTKLARVDKTTAEGILKLVKGADDE
jgi:hypothetical protein